MRYCRKTPFAGQTGGIYVCRHFSGHSDPIFGDRTGGGVCVLYETHPVHGNPACPDGICCRHHDCGFGVEPVDSGNGAECRYGKAGIFAGGDRFPSGNPFSAGAGSPDPAPAHEQQ